MCAVDMAYIIMNESRASLSARAVMSRPSPPLSGTKCIQLWCPCLFRLAHASPPRGPCVRCGARCRSSPLEAQAVELRREGGAREGRAQGGLVAARLVARPLPRHARVHRSRSLSSMWCRSPREVRRASRRPAARSSQPPPCCAFEQPRAREVAAQEAGGGEHGLGLGLLGRGARILK